MIQEPQNHGWKFYKSCACGGRYQEWFKKGTQTLKVFTRNDRFELISAGKILKWGKIHELKNYLGEVVSV